MEIGRVDGGSGQEEERMDSDGGDAGEWASMGKEESTTESLFGLGTSSLSDLDATTLVAASLGGSGNPRAFRPVGDWT